MEGDSRRHRSERRLSPISIHSLRMEGDCIIEFSKHNFNISIHSLHTEGDRLQLRRRQIPCHFNPLPPHGGRLAHDILEKAGCLFQSTPSAWRETAPAPGGTAVFCISIHSLRMEGDQLVHDTVRTFQAFQSTPSAWRETSPSYAYWFGRSFQSTPSAWRETMTPQDSQFLETHFNPLPPHGGRLLADQMDFDRFYFNPLPPHGGRPTNR